MTKNVWLISEECHGTIGVATSMLAGKQWLIEIAWVSMNSDVWIPQTDEITTLKNLYGENWEEHFLSFDTEELENMGFYFREIELLEEK